MFFCAIKPQGDVSFGFQNQSQQRYLHLAGANMFPEIYP